MTTRWQLGWATLAVLALSACSSEKAKTGGEHLGSGDPGGGKVDAGDGGDEAAHGDAGADSGTESDAAALSETCRQYCDCMAETCPGALPSDCKTLCPTLAEEALTCRLDHCVNADGDPATHCPHATGEEVCP